MTSMSENKFPPQQPNSPAFDVEARAVRYATIWSDEHGRGGLDVKETYKAAIAEYQAWIRERAVFDSFFDVEAALFDKIKHGDQAHQDWLREALKDFFSEYKGKSGRFA